ncbi:MAG: TolC family protein [Desulfobulbus sp.]|jgi:outer membrane protein TolC|nr:TolC family protein [Desulfobulbus sp.]
MVDVAEDGMRYVVAAVLSLLVCVGPVRAAEKGLPVADLSAVRVLDMSTAQAIALAANPSMTAARARVEQARERVSQAAAAWWPSLDLSGGASRQRLAESGTLFDPSMAALLAGTTDRNLEVYSAGLQATWVLFDGFYRRFRELQAEYDEQSAVAGLVDSRRLLVRAVAEAFLNAQLAQTNTGISQADETFYLRQLEDAENRYNVGVGPWGDILNIKVQLNTARTGLLRSQREFEAAGYGLAALMGLPEARFPERVRLQKQDQQTNLFAPIGDADTLIQEAQATRPDIRRLEMTVRGAEAATGMARAPFYPRLRAAGTVEGAREGDPGLSDENFGNTIGLQLSWNLYAGGADQARLAEAKQARREAAATKAGLHNEVAGEIRRDLALLASADEQVRLQRETVALVEENRELAKNEYDAGESPLIRLNEAQRDLVATYGRLALALAARDLAAQRLLAATGRNLAGFDAPAGDRR